jgi:hypothetical protein
MDDQNRQALMGPVIVLGEEVGQEGREFLFLGAELE